MPEPPVSDVDLYTYEARVNPYPIYDDLRALGPVVYLPRYDFYALPRYEQVRAALMGWRTFTSARGVFVDPALNAQLEGITLCSDPPEHTMMRGVLGRLRCARIGCGTSRPRSRRRRRASWPGWSSGGAVRRRHRTGRAPADGRRVQPGRAAGPGRAMMLELGSPRSGMSRARPESGSPKAMPLVEEFLAFADNDAVPGNISSDGWAAQLYEAADRGELPREKCPVMMLDYVTPSLDTTILAITNAIALFARHPEQWALVRSDRSLIPHAINESLRLESPVPQFSRVLTEGHEIGGATLSAGSRVALLYGSANRDERHYPDPERFDVTRRPSDHLAFGRGEHVCVGMHLARLEMTALLERLADRVAGFEIVAATPMINNGLRGLEHLEVTVKTDLNRADRLTCTRRPVQPARLIRKTGKPGEISTNCSSVAFLVTPSKNWPTSQPQRSR